jgi:hypothetical protein
MEASSHCPCFQKKGKLPLLEIIGPLLFSIIFSKVFEYIMHDHIYHFFKSKLNSSQHGFNKSKSTITNLVIFLDFVTPLVCSQGQVDSIHFDFSNAFDILPHALLLHKLNNYGLSYGYINWFHSYLTNRESCVRFQAYFLLLLLFYLVYLKAQF